MSEYEFRIIELKKGDCSFKITGDESSKAKYLRSRFYAIG